LYAARGKHVPVDTAAKHLLPSRLSVNVETGGFVCANITIVKIAAAQTLPVISSSTALLHMANPPLSIINSYNIYRLQGKIKVKLTSNTAVEDFVNIIATKYRQCIIF
jgi:hypothetical protein